MVSSRLKEGTRPEVWESLRFGGQAKASTQATPLSHGRARVQFCLLSSRRRPQHSRSWRALQFPSLTAAGQPCQVAVSFLQLRKENPGPLFLLGALEVSPSTCLTPISLPRASKGRVGGELPHTQPLLTAPAQLPHFSCPASPFLSRGSWAEEQGVVEGAGQEGREKGFSKLGKKENAKHLTPNLSLFKNRRFFPKVKNKKQIQCPCIPTAVLIPGYLLHSQTCCGGGAERGHVRDQRSYCPHPY